jgi:hypothetical protein
VSVAVIVAVGVNSDGRREVLGMDIGPSEAETFWTAGAANPEFFSRQGSSGAKTGSCELTPQQADVPRRLHVFPIVLS